MKHENVDLNIPNSVGSTPLHIAALQNNIETAAVLIEAQNINVNALDRLNRTPLMCAIRGEFCEIVKIILSRKDVSLLIADINGVCFCFIRLQLITQEKQNL